MKNYSESSNNIELLLSCADKNLSEEKVMKFKKRRKQCLKYIQSADSPHENTACGPEYTPNRFKITFDEIVGRNGEALEDIQIGDCVLIDEPIACRTKIGQELNEFCNNCLSKISPDMIISSPLDKDVRF